MVTRPVIAVQKRSRGQSQATPREIKVESFIHVPNLKMRVAGILNGQMRVPRMVQVGVLRRRRELQRPALRLENGTVPRCVGSE